LFTLKSQLPSKSVNAFQGLHLYAEHHPGKTKKTENRSR